jgi:hypothetical protein
MEASVRQQASTCLAVTNKITITFRPSSVSVMIDNNDAALKKRDDGSPLLCFPKL